MAELSQTTLALFFTYGYTLRDWDSHGLLQRETAIYRVLRPSLAGVRLVTYGGRRDVALARGLKGMELSCNRLGLRLAWYEAWLRRWAPRLWPRPLIVKTNQSWGAAVALAAARTAGAPLLMRCGYLNSFIQEQRFGADSPQARTARAEEGDAFRASAAAIVTTEVIKRRVCEAYGVEPGKVNVIPNYVDIDAFRPDPAAGAVPGRVCYIGRLHPEKNLLALIEAVAGIAGAELVLAGEGDQRAELEAAAARLGARVRFLGAVPHPKLPELIASSQAFCLPSLYEGHPKSIIEAMACGAAVVGTSVTGIREVVQDGVTGLLCGTSAAELRETLARLLGDGNLRGRLGLAAREFAAQSYALPVIAGRELAVLEEVAAHA